MGKKSNLGWKIICELSTPTDRAHFEPLNATFQPEIGLSISSYSWLSPVQLSRVGTQTCSLGLSLCSSKQKHCILLK